MKVQLMGNYAILPHLWTPPPTLKKPLYSDNSRKWHIIAWNWQILQVRMCIRSLCTHAASCRTSEEEVPFGGLLPLLQTGVEEAEKLQDPFFSTWLGQAGVVHHQVGVDLTVVTTYIKAASCSVVFLNDFHSGHEPGEEKQNKNKRQGIMNIFSYTL